MSTQPVSILRDVKDDYATFFDAKGRRLGQGRLEVVYEAALVHLGVDMRAVLSKHMFIRGETLRDTRQSVLMAETEALDRARAVEALRVLAENIESQKVDLNFDLAEAIMDLPGLPE